MPQYIVVVDASKRAKIMKLRIPASTGYRLVLTCEPSVDPHAIAAALNAHETAKPTESRSR